ncbi:hypothetical protein C8Q75DRAFT_713289 [Abortiporus biennis]|nr:hypothetical protein C8Q75DRAFT_713289 [Abortiporus biennis]
MDTTIPPATTATAQEASSPIPPELRRRHSDRAPTSPKAEEIITPIVGSPESSQSPQPRKKRFRRPQTAEGGRTSGYFPELSPQSSPTPISPPNVPPTNSPSSVTSPQARNLTTRPRSQTNPPLLHRLSVSLFGSPSASSPYDANMSGFPLTDSPVPSLPGSARPSMSRPSPKQSVEIPSRHQEELPEVYLQRLVEAVSKAEVATVLASSADEFHAKALRAYIERFDFSSDPLDVALRKLLMDVGLPRETQQIDRVMEAFASRYVQCNLNLFVSDDHPYILAFSLIMLHTDAFNKSNKRKMSKADYIKNTRLPGVAPEVLDCFYDNIVFAPFIFIEDPLDVNGQRGLTAGTQTPRRLSAAPSPGALNNSASTLLGKGSKIDPYYLITRNLLDDLRVNVQAYVPFISPYFYQGTAGPWDEEKLLRAFATAGVVEVSANDSRYHPSPWFSLSVGAGPGPLSIGGLPSPVAMSNSDAFAIKVTKVGVLLRKDDLLEGGRKAMNRKWKEWSLLLTGSQLLMCRDPSWAIAIQAQINPVNGEVQAPQAFTPRPEELVTVKDAIAVFDRSYTKYPNTFRLVLPDGRHIFLKAPDEEEMNEWIACINYASAFKTAGVRMRSLGMSWKDIELTGKAAAASHLRDLQHRGKVPNTPRIWGSPSNSQTGDISSSVSSGLSRMRAGSVDSATDELSTPPIETSSRLLKATFDQVKLELASGRWTSVEEVSNTRTFIRPRAFSLESALNSPTSPTAKLDPVYQMDKFDVSRLSSRSRIIRSKVKDLESKISLARSQLDADMRFVRNIAVLTPFQRATRERLQSAVQNVAKRIMQVRLDMEKLVCHRDVLSRDLFAEEREWQQTKSLALRAATATLQSQSENAIPRMTLSVYLDTSRDQTSSPVPIPRSAESTNSRRPESSVGGESFHSAMDFGSDWFQSPYEAQKVSPSTFLPPPASSSSELNNRASSSTLSESPAQSKPLPLRAEQSMESTSTTCDDSVIISGHEKFYTASEVPEEQAEEWDKTRAAKRVSLVKVPSDLRISVLFGKHETEAIHEDTHFEGLGSSSSKPLIEEEERGGGVS